MEKLPAQRSAIPATLFYLVRSYIPSMDACLHIFYRLSLLFLPVRRLCFTLVMAGSYNSLYLGAKEDRVKVVFLITALLNVHTEK